MTSPGTVIGAKQWDDAMAVRFGSANSLVGMVNLRMPSWCRVLVLGFILFDYFLGTVGVSRRHEDADFEDV